MFDLNQATESADLDIKKVSPIGTFCIFKIRKYFFNYSTFSLLYFVIAGNCESGQMMCYSTCITFPTIYIYILMSLK